MKRISTVILAISVLVASLAGCGGSTSSTTSPASSTTPSQSSAASASFPSKNINGIVQWGAGGGTDSLMRPLASLAEKELGVSIVVQNKTGGTGSIATKYVYDEDSDGYNLLMGAENPALYKALEISDLTYSDFDCVLLIGDETVGVIVGKDSKYNTFTDIINDALANPGKIKLSTTGAGGLPWEVGAFITYVTGATFNQVPYDSDATARTAVMGGECDFTVAKVQSGIEAYKNGDIKFLAMFAKDKLEMLPDVPSVLDEYPDFEQFLPWGPYYGVFVKKGTDAGTIKALSEAFKKAFDDPTYQQVLTNFNINKLGYSGDEAAEYIKSWQKNTITALYESGAIKKSPSELGV